jgi:hypothetical protein
MPKKSAPPMKDLHLPDEPAAPEADGTAAAESPAETAEAIEGATENMPEVPDEIREAARLAPDHWLGMVDPTWSGDGAPPPWAIVGQWRSGLDGEIVEWQENPEYRPSPKALDWPDPLDDVDAAVQLAATGYGPAEHVTTALAALPELAVFVTPDGAPLAATAPDEKTAVIPAFTSPAYLHMSGRLAFKVMKVADLVDQLPEDHVIYLNPSAPVSMTVETDVLKAALAGEPLPTAPDPGQENAADAEHAE